MLAADYDDAGTGLVCLAPGAENPYLGVTDVE